MLLPATDPSCVAQARRHARYTALSAGFDEEDAERAAIVASELCSNAVKHAGGGTLAVQPFDDADGTGVEVVASDRGAGIGDLSRCLTDGYSTAGTAGAGLGAVRRLSQHFHVYSRPSLGCVVLARLARDTRAPPRSGFVTGGVWRPIDGEHECGDAFAHEQQTHVAALTLADGLGHGPAAATAARVAVAAFEQGSGAAGTAEATIGAIHMALRPTRGAAIAVARIDIAAGTVDYGGIGNISGALVEKGVTRRMITEHGTAGHVAGRVRALRYEFVSPPLVLLHSDGIKTSWDLARYPGLSEAHPALVAAVLMRDFRRDRDDASVIALRWRSTP